MLGTAALGVVQVGDLVERELVLVAVVVEVLERVLSS